MKYRFIVKNIKKYNNIKLAKGVALKQFAMLPRDTTGSADTGISTGTYGDYWFKTPNGKALFKTFYGYGHEIRNIRMYNELLCNELCKQIDMPCAEYETAYYEEDNGVITYNILKQGEKLQALDDFAYETPDGEINLEIMSKVFDEYIQTGSKINKKQEILNLYRIAVFDYLTMQTDRNDRNISMVYNSRKNSFKVAPLFDNEFAFAGQALLKLKNNNMCLSDKLFYVYTNQCKMFSISYDNCDNQRIKKQVKYIAAYAKKYPAMKQIVQNMLENLDVEKAIQNLEQQGHTISREYKEYVKNIMTYTTHTLSEAINQQVSQKDISDLENVL